MLRKVPLCDAAAGVVRRSSGPGTGVPLRTGRPGARSRKSTAPTTGPGPSTCATPGPRKRRYSAATSPRRPSSTPGCSGSSLRRSKPPRRRPGRRACASASSPTWRSGRTPAARTRGPGRSSSRRGSPSARRRTPSTSAARTGGCRPCTPGPSRPPGTGRWPTSSAPTFPSAAACGSTTSWGCPGCGGFPPGQPPTEGAYVYYDAQGTLGTLAAAAAATGRGRHRRGPGHGRAVAARRTRRPGRARHADAVVRARLVQRAPGPAVVAEELPRHGLHPRPAARRRVPVRVAGDRPAGARPADPLRGRGAGGGRPDGQRLDRRPRQRGAAARPAGARSADEFTVALYGYLAKTPALLIGVNLAEAAGETRSQNMPGTTRRVPELEAPPLRPRRHPGPPGRPGHQRPRPRGRPRRLRRSCRVHRRQESRRGRGAWGGF